MKKLEYTVSFNTPAFLGNAEQQAQWRTPPFKALIRQWWRVVKAKDVGYDHERLLLKENRLFGAAADDGGGSHRSLVRFRLSAWNMGTSPAIEDAGNVCHPEVHHHTLPNCPDGKPGKLIRANAYLGFGPIGTHGLTHPPSIQANVEKATLHLMSPPEYLPELEQALQLAAWFGTLGSRSRNGWGALHIEGNGTEELTAARLKPYLRPLNDCLKFDWPHAIGSDAKGALLWQTEAKASWREVMKELARIKIAFRTHFKFTGGGPHFDMQNRLILAYPVTKHSHSKLGNNERLANQLRFKVTRQPDGKLRGILVHVPCKVPEVLVQKLSPKDQQFVRGNELAIWQAVHAVLDQNAQRIG